MGTTYRDNYPNGISIGMGTRVSIQTSSVIFASLILCRCLRPMPFQLCILIGIVGFLQLVTGVAGFVVTMFRAEKVTYAVSGVCVGRSESVDDFFQRLDHHCRWSSRLGSDWPFDLLPRLPISSKAPMRRRRRRSSDVIDEYLDEQ